jgi:hypothetical protein
VDGLAAVSSCDSIVPWGRTLDLINVEIRVIKLGDTRARHECQLSATCIIVALPASLLPCCSLERLEADGLNRLPGERSARGL